MTFLALAGLTVSAAGALFTSPAGAATTVTAVSGSAYGEKVTALSGSSGPTPTVTLPSTGGGPLTASDPGVSVPALTTGAMSVSTQGTLGPAGIATSSATVNTPTVPTNPPSQPPLFTASRVTSMCQSDGTTSTGSATFLAGFVRNTAIPIVPAPNTPINDPLYGNVILNEQIVSTTATGTSITVNAAHISRFPADDIIIGQTHCDTTFAQVTTTTTLPSTPTVTAVSGSAYGEKVTALSGSSGPTPMVTLPSTGGGPLTASDPGVSVPALTTGAMNVSTQGTLGPAGQAQSSSVVNNATVPTNPPSNPPLFTAFRLDSQCTATANGVTGSASFVGGFVRSTAIPFAPAPNTPINDPLYGNVIVNEQIVNNTAMGTSITVNAAHISRFPADDIILGQSHCDTTFAPITTTSTTSSTTTSSTTSTTSTTSTSTSTSTTTSTVPTGPTCNGKPATIVGTPGNDRIFGTPGDDVIVGLGGDDQIYGNGGNDTICGGDGNEVIYGGTGNDWIDGGPGDDRIIGNGGTDTLLGGTGSDRLFAGSGTTTLNGGPGLDYCYKGTGSAMFVDCEVFPTGR